MQSFQVEHHTAYKNMGRTLIKRKIKKLERERADCKRGMEGFMFEAAKIQAQVYHDTGWPASGNTQAWDDWIVAAQDMIYDIDQELSILRNQLVRL